MLLASPYDPIERSAPASEFIQLDSGACSRRVQAEEGSPPQRHSAAACGEGTQWLKLWYAEYKDGIIQEVLFWREFEDDVASHSSVAGETT
jgi:hypothetical protein